MSRAPSRLRLPGIAPLEVWDLELERGLLFELQQEADFPALLLEALIELRGGRAKCRWSAGSLSPCRDFGRLVLAGGWARDLALSAPFAAPAASRSLPVPLEVLPGGAAGPARAVAAALGEGAWVLDLGQSAAKLAAGGLFFRRERDLSVLPLRRPGTLDEDMAGQRLEIGQQRLALRAMLEDLLEEAGASLGRPAALVLALPSEVAEDLLPGGSSYVGMGGDATLAADLGRRVGAPAGVLNDAELAAWAAALTLASPPFPALVLTLGFAVGGALIEAPGVLAWTAGFRAMIGES